MQRSAGILGIESLLETGFTCIQIYCSKEKMEICWTIGQDKVKWVHKSVERLHNSPESVRHKIQEYFLS